MTPATELACPVCRAKQPYQVECRRCGADLSLWVKALRSLEAAQRQLEQAPRDRDTTDAHNTLAYLRWLSPRSVGSTTR